MMFAAKRKAQATQVKALIAALLGRKPADPMRRSTEGGDRSTAA